MRYKNKSPEQIIAALKATRWWTPTVRKYQQHLNACAENNCTELAEAFADFAQDVLNTPEGLRDSLLSDEEWDEYVPFQHYAAYTTPVDTSLGFYGVGMGRKLR